MLPPGRGLGVDLDRYTAITNFGFKFMYRLPASLSILDIAAKQALVINWASKLNVVDTVANLINTVSAGFNNFDRCATFHHIYDRLFASSMQES